jgi:protein arginine kinase
MAEPLHLLSDRWLSPSGPESDIVVSSRSRLARNLTGHSFPCVGKAEDLRAIAGRIAKAITAEPMYRDYRRIELGEISGAERMVLREAHLISPELERHGKHCAVFLSQDARISIMINEEDHLRMQAIESGYRVREAHHLIEDVDNALSRHLRFAFSPRLGYLTACPTNTGTGLRASVMLHLPALVMGSEIEKIIKDIAEHGFAVRGLYGEGSHCAGDLYQISNEVTLGKSEAEVVAGLLGMIDQLITREREGRGKLFKERLVFVEDSIWRSYATLSQARTINSAEAISLLSRLRLGIDRGHFGERLTHHDLNRLLIQIQPAHLTSLIQVAEDTETRDTARADYLRRRMAELVNGN